MKWALIVAILLLAPVVGAQFDPAAKSLPPRFAGADFPALYRRLAIAPKDEFETTQQYESRAKQVATGVSAFRVPDPSIAYNADDARFTITIYKSTLRTRRAIDIDHELLVVHEKSEKTGRYVGSNAFGVEMAVEKVTQRKWGLLLDSRSHKPIRLTLSISPERARMLKSRLAVLLLCNVGPQSIPERMTGEKAADLREATGFNISGATINAPIDLKTYYYAIRADLLGFWIFDTQTGEVLGRYTPAGLLAGPPEVHPGSPPGIRLM